MAAPAKTYTRDLTKSPTKKSFEIHLTVVETGGQYAPNNTAKSIGQALEGAYFLEDYGLNPLTVSVKEIATA